MENNTILNLVKQCRRCDDWIKAINSELEYKYNYNKEYVTYLQKLKLEFICDLQNFKNRLYT